MQAGISMFNSSKPKSKSKSKARSPKSKQAKSTGRTGKTIRTTGYDSQQPSPIVQSPFFAQSTKHMPTKNKKKGLVGKTGTIKPSLATSYTVAQP